MGFYVPGEVAFLCDIAQPQIGVVSNVGTVHAERAGSQEAIARGKAELVQALPAAPDGVAILNFDDPYVRRMEERPAPASSSTASPRKPSCGRTRWKASAWTASASGCTTSGRPCTRTSR
jgi:UDP-N-acetylmuramyl pentapeptide synthase